jgi:hypothetical protein
VPSGGIRTTTPESENGSTCDSLGQAVSRLTGHVALIFVMWRGARPSAEGVDITLFALPNAPEDGPRAQSTAGTLIIVVIAYVLLPPFSVCPPPP